MAGDWIKFRTSLARDGRLLIASRKCHAGTVTNVTQVSQARHAPVTMLGAVVMFWCHADEHASEDGVLVGYVAEDIDSLVGMPGFCAALPSDWITFTPEGWVQMPDYKKHNGQNAKKRAGAADRKQSQRERDKSHAPSVTGVTGESQECPEKVTPREEKRRVNTPIVPKGDIPEALLRARGLFRTRHSTPLDSSQINGWKKNKAAVEATTEDDWRALEWWFLQPTEKDDPAEFRRTSLGTLLNHWNDEITKARRAAVKDGVSFVGEKKKAAVAPEDWQQIIGESCPEMHLPAEFGELPESVRHWVLEKVAEKKKGDANE